MSKKGKIFTLFISFLAILFFNFQTAEASSRGLEIINHPLAFTDEFKLITSENNERFRIPWEWEPLTPAYEYSFITKGFYDPSRPMEVKIYYPEKSDNFKQIFSFDFLSSVWRPVPTKDYPLEQYVSMTTDATSAWLIVLEKPGVMTVGNASWYKYKEGLFAASPDFAKGSVLRVHNINNGKYVDVTINDYGPDRKIHPDRVIDLDRVAFEKIASLGAGIVPVRVEVISEVLSNIQQATPQISDVPNLTAASAIIMRDSDAKILWSNNEKSVAPIASLTKLSAVKVFLDTKPDLTKVVTYKQQDSNYNHNYVTAGLESRLRVAEGDTLTIENLLYSTLVGSANNTIETLVRVSGLSRNEFIARMNKLASDLGATNTKFIEPSGLSENNVSSPYDYAIISREILKNPLIQKISSTKSYSFQTLNTEKSFRLTNTNQLLKNSELPIAGSKTGYLDEAGYCLLTKVKSAQDNLILINLNSSSKENNFADHEKLIRYGLKVLANQN